MTTELARRPSRRDVRRPHLDRSRHHRGPRPRTPNSAADYEAALPKSVTALLREDPGPRLEPLLLYSLAATLTLGATGALAPEASTELRMRVLNDAVEVRTGVRPSAGSGCPPAV
jgi:hypothetical protein